MDLLGAALLLLLVATTPRRSKGVTPSTVVLKRGADASLTALLDASILESFEPDACIYSGLINFAHPMSLNPSDKFFATGQLQLKSIEMMVDEINTSPRCGVTVDGKQYGITLTTYGDDSNGDKVGAIVENGMIPAAAVSDANTTFWLGPYSSGLTGAMSPYANETKTIMVAGGAADTSVFEGYDTIFGTFPPTEAYLAQAIEALAKAGAKTVASVYEDASFTAGVCSALPDLTKQFGLELQSETLVVASPTAEALDPIASNFSTAESDPDVVVTCVYDSGCAEWIGALRRANWSPRSQVFTVCIGMDSFIDAVGLDAMYMAGISPWDPSLSSSDSVVGWSPAEFAELHLATTFRTATYHSASAAASVGALIQAIERANSFDSDSIVSILANEEFTTLYGTLSFDSNGQSKAPSLFLQYDVNSTVQTVYPLDASSGSLVYPMPTWVHRDCMFTSTCETGSVSTVIGECQVDGTCKCQDSSALSIGVGPDARCIYVPEEDMTFISSPLLIVGAVLFSIQAILSVSSWAWTIYYREHKVVKASQPLFLCLISFGALILCAGIIPLGIQDNNPANNVDAACMAMPWLVSMGFSILFSALFAKIWRIMLVWRAATRMRPKKVEAKDVASIMVGVVMLQAVVLLCWTFIDPLKWEREVLLTDLNGYALESYGSCRSDNIMHFLIPLVCIDGLMLLYALFLCFKTRKISSEYQEGTWITASVLSISQILALAIPILVIVGSNNDAFYFMRAAAIFLISSTVTILIFAPKVYRVHFWKPKPVVSRFGSAVGTQSRYGSNAESVGRRGSENGSCIGRESGTGSASETAGDYHSRRATYNGGFNAGSVVRAINPASLASKIAAVVKNPANVEESGLGETNSVDSGYEDKQSVNSKQHMDEESNVIEDDAVKDNANSSKQPSRDVEASDALKQDAKPEGKVHDVVDEVDNIQYYKIDDNSDPGFKEKLSGSNSEQE